MNISLLQRSMKAKTYRNVFAEAKKHPHKSNIVKNPLLVSNLQKRFIKNEWLNQ
jgi:hypothetical protein